MNLKIKIITGYRIDQEHTLDADEAHKAYYLFMNPDKRAIFRSGLAIKGTSIEAIEPDFHATMGWNSSHKLTGEDWNELRAKGIPERIQSVLEEARDILPRIEKEKELLSKPLSEIILKLK